MTTATSLLPAEAYWSPAWYRAEQDRLFARTWNLVGTIEDFGGAIPAGAETWEGYVFVNPSGTAPPLTTYLGDFPDRIGGFRPGRLVEVARHRFELAANWKFFVENHIDVYHLWYLHGESLGAYDHPRAEWSDLNPHWVFYEPPRAGVDANSDAFRRGLRTVEHIGSDRWGSGAHLIFPNFTMASGSGFFSSYACTPLGPERSVVDLRVRAEPGSEPAAMLALSLQVIEAEDGAACEALQSAVRSPWFEVGPLAADHEAPIRSFHRHLLDAMSAS